MRLVRSLRPTKLEKLLTRFAILRLAVTIRQDWLTEPLVELRFAAKESRHQEVEQTPQLEDVVLNGRARQN